MDIFNVILGVAGLFYNFAGIYEIKWIWRLARGGYLPNQLGVKNTRLMYMIGGGGMFGFAIGFLLQSQLKSDGWHFYLIGLIIATTLTEFLFRNHEKRSIIKFIFDKDA